MQKKPDIGNQELEVLRFISDHSPCTVRDATQNFGEPRGLARTTVLTMMERLRIKGYLARHKTKGSYQYTAVVPKTDLLNGLVQNFVEKTLAGSVTPFVAYLAENKDLTESEYEALKQIVDNWDNERR